MWLLWMSAEALALDCAYGVYDLSLNGVDEVPPDVLILGTHSFGEPDGTLDVRIVDATDQVVPATVELLPYVLRVTPDDELAMGDYTLEVDQLQYTEPAGWPFTVGQDPGEVMALDAPTGLVATRESSRDPDWGDSTGIELQFDRIEGASAYEIEVSTTEDFGAPSLAISTHASAWVGDGLCGQNLSDYEHDVPNWVRVRGVAHDGTVTAWSDTVEVPRGRPPGALFSGGCSAVPGGGGLSALGLAMGLLAGRRRSRRA